MKNKLKKFLYTFCVFTSFLTAGVYWQDHFQSGSLDIASESGDRKSGAADEYASEDQYSREIQPIFNNRCIACHGCMDAPCQFNLQSYEGAMRGGHKMSVYNGARLKPMDPSRMFEDAKSVDQWRGMGFFDVVKSEPSLFLTLINLGQHDNDRRIQDEGEENLCPQKMERFYSAEDHQRLAMPYGLPKLNQVELDKLAKWVKEGATGPTNISFKGSEKVSSEVDHWETFLNASDLKSRITARYLYEHLFLAHIYFQKSPREFFKLVRSRTECSKDIDVIATRRPNDSPGVSEWFYCLQRDRQTVVYKNHIPYEFNEHKLNMFKKMFIESDWQPTAFPSFEEKVATNPFKAFREMPAKARYEFLLYDSQYHIMTFIKGPVCNGSRAVNSIQEQFYTIFFDPKSDLSSNDPEYAKFVEDQLILPGDFGVKVGLFKIEPTYETIATQRNLYRKTRSQHLKKIRPNGLTLDDVWDGWGWNQNAFLTVFRHDDNSKVVKGAVGDTSKTVFMLDYPLFERLVYNLVVNFDVYGNVGHQSLTRMYMDFLRMEAENNFLDFLPQPARKQIKKDWYVGKFTNSKLEKLDEYTFTDIPNAIPFKMTGRDVKNELLQDILFTRLNKHVRGPEDLINWKKIKSVSNPDSDEAVLSEIASVKKEFVRRFPELTFLIITEQNIPDKGYSLIHNREHTNISFILFEGTQIAPKEATFTIQRGYLGSYPNLILRVERSQLKQMVREISAIDSQEKYLKFKNVYQLDRRGIDFWPFYDFINRDLAHLQPIEAGFMDLSHLE